MLEPGDVVFLDFLGLGGRSGLGLVELLDGVDQQLHLGLEGALGRAGAGSRLSQAGLEESSSFSDEGIGPLDRLGEDGELPGIADADDLAQVD